MTFDNPDFDYDFDIAGVRFLSAASEAYPYQRGLSKVVKDQLDTSTEPGDNSLQGWWTRSQTDWSGGTGSDYMEPASNELVRRQFYDSAGVDVFHYPGYFDLLPSASLLQTRTGDTAFLARTVDGYAVGWGDQVSVYDADENASSVTVSETVVGLIVAGKYLLVATRWHERWRNAWALQSPPLQVGTLTPLPNGPRREVLNNNAENSSKIS